MAGITAQMIAFHATIRHIMINSSLRGNISQFQVERAKREPSKRNVSFSSCRTTLYFDEIWKIR